MGDVGYEEVVACMRRDFGTKVNIFQTDLDLDLASSNIHVDTLGYTLM